MERFNKLNHYHCIVVTAALSVLSLSIDHVSAATLTGDVIPGVISGYAGSAFQIGPAESNRAVYGVWSVERKDNPCYIATLTEDINNAGDNSGSKKDLCGNNATSKEMKVEFSDAKFSDHTFVRALRVCMNDKNTRVKGFQIYGRKIESNGHLVDLPHKYPGGSSSGMSAYTDQNAPLDQRPNCNGKWKRWSTCPTGTIATSLVAHFEAGSTPRSLTGIALNCRAVQ